MEGEGEEGLGNRPESGDSEDSGNSGQGSFSGKGSSHTSLISQRPRV